MSPPESQKPEKQSKTARAAFPSLEHLFGSKTRARLLSLFIHHPERSYFVRELTRVIGAQIHSVRRELDNLEKMGILESEEKIEKSESGLKVKHKYYRISRACPLLPELKALITKAELFIEKHLGEHIKNLGDLYFIALTGRLVGNDDFPTDLFLIGEADPGRLQFFLKHLNNEVGYDVNYTLMSPQEFRYRMELTDKFLYGMLEGKKTVLIDRLEELGKRK